MLVAGTENFSQDPLDLSPHGATIAVADVWRGATASLGIKRSILQRGDVPPGGEGYESPEVGPKTRMDTTQKSGRRWFDTGALGGILPELMTGDILTNEKGQKG